MATAAAGQLASGRGGYVIERDAMVAREEPGPHSGGGRTVGYSFFSGTPGLKLVFRKRVLQPGSGIGCHEQKEDEIYYVLSGRGQMTLDGRTVHPSLPVIVVVFLQAAEHMRPPNGLTIDRAAGIALVARPRFSAGGA